MTAGSLRLGSVLCGIAGVVLLLAHRFELGLFLVVSAVPFAFVARHVARETATAGEKQRLLYGRFQDFVNRLDQGATLDEIAREYERADGIPPTQTLRFCAKEILEIAGRGKDKGMREDLNVILARQAASIVPAAADLIPRFSFAQNVFLVCQEARSFTNASGSASTGMVIFALGYLYFFVDPDSSTRQSEFAKGLAKEHVIHETGIPYLGVAAWAWEASKAVREAEAEFFEPKFVESLRRRFALPGSFAIPLRRVSFVSTVNEDEGSTLAIRRRLLIRFKGEDGTPIEHRLGMTELADDRRAMEMVDFVRSLCLLEGTFLHF